MPKKLNKEYILVRLDSFKNNYNFDNKDEVIIECPNHGYFEQCPNNNIRGTGCNECSKEKPIKNKKYLKYKSLKKFNGRTELITTKRY